MNVGDDRIRVQDGLGLHEADLSTLGQLVREAGLVVVTGLSLAENSFRRLVEAIGDPVMHPFLPRIADGVSLLERDSDRIDDVLYGGAWHQNLTFLQRPPDVSVLYASAIEDPRNFTAFVDLAEVNPSLSIGLRTMLERERAVHSTAAPNSPQHHFTTLARGVHEEAIHPCHWHDAGTGLQWPFVTSGYVVQLEGWAPRESMPLITSTLMLATRDEFVIRHYWEAGQLLLWDNRRFMHRATATHRVGRRRLLRADLHLGW